MRMIVATAMSCACVRASATGQLEFMPIILQILYIGLTNNLNFEARSDI